MWETRVRSLGWEEPLEKEMATHSNTLAWRIPWTAEPGPWGLKELDMTEQLSTAQQAPTHGVLLTTFCLVLPIWN